MNVKGSILTIPSIRLPDGSTSKKQTVDLALYQGGIVRVYIDRTGAVRVNPTGDCYWQVCEMHLPTAASTEVQQGTISQAESAERSVTRSAKAKDVIKLASNESISRVGFVWAVYATPADYTEAGGIITWAKGRGPGKDDTYNIEITTTTKQPNIVSQPVPLDLSTIKITAFAAPKIRRNNHG